MYQVNHIKEKLIKIQYGRFVLKCIEENFINKIAIFDIIIEIKKINKKQSFLMPIQFLHQFVTH